MEELLFLSHRGYPALGGGEMSPDLQVKIKSCLRSDLISSARPHLASVSAARIEKTWPSTPSIARTGNEPGKYHMRVMRWLVLFPTRYCTSGKYVAWMNLNCQETCTCGGKVCLLSPHPVLENVSSILSLIERLYFPLFYLLPSSFQPTFKTFIWTSQPLIS